MQGKYSANTEHLDIALISAILISIVYIMDLSTSKIFLYSITLFLLIFAHLGRILNRFSKDIGLVDDMFSFVFFDFTQVENMKYEYF